MRSCLTRSTITYIVGNLPSIANSGSKVGVFSIEKIIPLNERERECKRDVGTESETHVHIG